MENRNNNPFIRRDYFKSNIAGLLQSETKGLNLVTGRLNALNQHPSLNNNEHMEKRKILEKCLALFRSQKFLEHVKKEKAKRGILDQEAVTKETRLANLHKIAEYSEELTDRLGEIVLGDLKRKYNMSDKCTSGMLKTGLRVRLNTIHNGQSVTKQDSLGNTITIEHIGNLEYDTLSSNEYICQYRVTKQLSQKDLKTYEVFSYIDLKAFDEDENYRKAVIQDLLSDNNIEFSNANGYIGKINNTTESSTKIKVGEQLDESNYYRYQISPEYALEYDGERIEALRTYNQQQERQHEIQEEDGR